MRTGIYQASGAKLLLFNGRRAKNRPRFYGCYSIHEKMRSIRGFESSQWWASTHDCYQSHYDCRNFSGPELCRSWCLHWQSFEWGVMLNKLHAFPLSCQTKLAIIRIPCIALPINLASGALLAESREAKLCTIRKSPPLSAIFRGREKSVGSAWGKLPIISW
jgi:hypothetical protein